MRDIELIQRMARRVACSHDAQRRVSMLARKTCRPAATPRDGMPPAEARVARLVAGRRRETVYQGALVEFRQPSLIGDVVPEGITHELAHVLEGVKTPGVLKPGVAKNPERPQRKGEAMQGKTSCVLALVLVCGVGRAGEPIPDGARFVGHMRKATVELVGVTYRPNVKSRWWRPDGTSPATGPYLSAFFIAD